MNVVIATKTARSVCIVYEKNTLPKFIIEFKTIPTDMIAAAIEKSDSHPRE